jgi:hypothetical protein
LADVELCEKNIKTDLRKEACVGVDWIKLVEDRFQWWGTLDMVMKFWVP